MPKKQILFIINPISGGKKKDKVPALIEKHLDKSLYDHKVIFTREPKQAGVIAKANLDASDIIVAVGGDGTVNEIAAVLATTEKVFGILPYGSGNGLSRFLGVPMDAVSAIKNINHLRTETIDGGKFNGRWFFNMAGIGFDAHISEVFSHQEKRGFITYINSSLKEVLNYKPDYYHIDIDGVAYDSEAFMLSFANSSQYGNNVHASPTASVQDGLTDVCIIKPFPLYRFFEMVLRSLLKTTQGFKYLKIVKGKHIRISRQGDGPIHIDGEPMIAGPELLIEVVPSALKIIVGKDYRDTYGKK